MVQRPASSVFGVAMMFLYYGYLLPLSTRIRRGLYQDGIWTDSGFMPYVEIGGLTWKGSDTLVLASRHKTIGRRLTVPGPHLGEVRHVAEGENRQPRDRVRRRARPAPRDPRHEGVGVTSYFFHSGHYSGLMGGR